MYIFNSQIIMLSFFVIEEFILIFLTSKMDFSQDFHTSQDELKYLAVG